MTVTNVRIKRLNLELPRLKGYATIVFDHELAINRVKIIQAENRMCVEFPKDPDDKKAQLETIAPLNPSFRKYIESIVLKAYRIGGDYFLKEEPYEDKKSDLHYGYDYATH